MKNKQKIMSTLLILLCWSVSNYAQQNRLSEAMERISKTNNIIKEKDFKWKAALTSISLLSKEEFKKRCGIISDTTFKGLEQKQYGKKLYEEWKNIKNNGLEKTTLSVNWQNWMSNIEDQGNCGNCWAHAATGVTEGLLHYSYGQNINIDLNEMEITDNAICADGCNGCDYGHVECGLLYIRDYENTSENHWQFPNRTNAYYSISSYSKESESINAIQLALASSPVWATMSVYEDFQDYSTGIYEYTYGDYVGDHAITIVGYDNEDDTDYWLCKNSWGSNWGENGYFKIKFGECGIDSYGNFVTATTNSHSFASFVPQFFSQPSNAVQYSKEDEITYIEGSCTLNNNVSIPTNKHIYILSNSSINFNLYFITSTGGTITVESNATLSPDIRRKQSTVIKGLYSSIQSAINASTTNQVVEVRSTCILDTDTTIPSGKTLILKPGSVLTMNNHKITTTSGTITIENNVDINPDVRLRISATVKGLYPNIQSALNDQASNQNVKLAAGDYTENITMRDNSYLLGAGRTQTDLFGTVTFNNVDDAILADLSVSQDITIQGGDYNCLDRVGATDIIDIDNGVNHEVYECTTLYDGYIDTYCNDPLIRI